MNSKIFDRVEYIKLENVSKRYGSHYAVRNLYLEIEGGEMLILIGPSGSGKTTTLRMINRLIEPDEGEILINGMNILDLDAVKLRRNIGYVIQQIGLFPHMTVKENIGLIPKLEGWSEEEITERVGQLLELVQLPPDIFMNRYPSQLSGGQQQRVGLARALAMDPPLLLMDEPFGALDPILRKQLQEEFLKIKQEIGRTIVFVTHDIDEAFKLGDRIAIMRDGRLIQTGEPEEFVLNPKNEFVSGLVNADRKFRHIDNLKVKDLMKPLEKKYLFAADMGVDEAFSEMMNRDVEMAVVETDFGIVTMRDLLNNRNRDKKLEEVAKPAKIFSPSDSLAAALMELKKDDLTVAIVVEERKAVGILLADDVLLRLI
jgi:osmoprotectant transport system ATP-binding protein